MLPGTLDARGRHCRGAGFALGIQQPSLSSSPLHRQGTFALVFFLPCLVLSPHRPLRLRRRPSPPLLGLRLPSALPVVRSLADLGPLSPTDTLFKICSSPCDSPPSSPPSSPSPPSPPSSPPRTPTFIPPPPPPTSTNSPSEPSCAPSSTYYATSKPTRSTVGW